MPARNGAGPEAAPGGHNTQFVPPPRLVADAAEPAAARPRGPAEPPLTADAPPALAGLVPAATGAVVEEIVEGGRVGRATAPPAAG